MNSTKFRCYLNQKTPMQTVSFVNMHDKVYGLNWRLCGENVACTKDARCEFFFSKFLCTSGWFSSAATDATLKFSSDNELCDFIMEQTSCSHPNWSNLHVKEYHWLGEQAESTLLKPTGRVWGQECDFKHAYFSIYRAACICLTCLSNLVAIFPE